MLAPPVARNDETGLKDLDASGRAIEHVGARAAVRIASQPARIDQVDGDPVIEQFYAGRVEHPLGQLRDDGLAGGIGYMQYTPDPVSALTGQVVFVVGGIEVDALLDEAADGGWSPRDGEFHDLPVA